MSHSNLSRRGFLSVAVASVAASSAQGAEVPRDGIDEQTIAEAEKLSLVRYSAAERATIVAGIEAQLALVRARRALPLDFADAPAVRFDPRPPGFEPAPLPKRSRWSEPEGEPTAGEDLAFASIGTLAALLRKRRVTSEALTRLALDRLHTQGPRLCCVAALPDEIALAQARAADAEIRAGRYRGPLHGIPYGAKDLLDTAGQRTAWGAEPYRDRVPTTDAAVVRRLREAGAVLVAKLAAGALGQGERWYGGRTRNPWNPGEGSSGSSGGSAAATAAGLVPFALGTETYGSIVSPAMRCGTVGLRPTFGRVPRTGAMPLAWSLDKIGPLTRRVEDAALVLSVLNGADRGDPASVDLPFRFDVGARIDGLRVGYDPAWFEGAEALDHEVVKRLERLGLVPIEVRLRELPWDGLLPILLAEAAASFEELTSSDRDDELGLQDAGAWPNRFRSARLFSAVDLVQAERLRRHAINAMATVFSEVDLLVGPSFGGPLLLATNFTGHPALTLRTGFVRRRNRSGLGDEEEIEGALHTVPHGITLTGRLYDEATLCAVGCRLEAALGVADVRPLL